ncbi:MAG: ABC transporter ATP-binding protein [Candidatus Pacebacteria bacterium]|nr:ABC transporter ATP-binding protein [Candidatus Paceibacterota bacterium]MBP9840322.1 ABC transporter ATP-binding protein [Candidatus Paceibacterota bacterium]
MQKQTRSWTRRTFGIYAAEAARHPVAFFFVLLGTFSLQGAMLLAPLYLRNFFNLLVTESPTEEVMAAIFFTLGLIAGAYLLEWASRRIFTFSIIQLETKVMASLYDRAFGYLVRHSYHFFSSQFAGTLTRRVSKFAHSFETVFDAIMMQFFPTALFVFGAVTILYFRNATIGLMLGGWVVLFIVVQIVLMRMQQPLRRARADEDSRTVGALADAVSNQSTITLFSGVGHEVSRFRNAVRTWQKAVVRVWVADEYAWSVLGLLMAGIEIAVLYGAVIYWQQGLLTIGDFALIQAYLLTTFDRLVMINRDLRRFNESLADAGEMVEILETPLDISDAKSAHKLNILKGSIEFKDVDFSFVPERPLLSNFSLSVAGGEKVALVGPSGAGKSTITKLILRLYDVVGGEVMIDGQDIRKMTQESVRDAIAFVPQEPILFHRTLMENIRYGRRDATDEEVIAAAKEAHCYDFIMAAPEQFETFVGERGIRLSGGERQRIAIARAILKDAPILVLDEATSSLDSESEALIQDALAKLMQGKTVIAIAHRLSTVMKMDRIVVIEDGKVATSGTHDELVRHEGGLYKKLWEIQAGGFITDDTTP